MPQCHICGEQTSTCCSDCRIDLGASVYVCAKRDCREEHDRRCPGVLRKQVEKLAKFKSYVHQRLDEAGVPADPNSPHKAEGCRIGGRLDVVLERFLSK